MTQTGAGRTAQGLQSPAGLAQADPFDAYPGEQLAHHARLVLHHLDPGGAAAGVAADVAVAVGCRPHGADRTREGSTAPAAAAALQDAGALVLGDHTLHLQQQV
ncbi:MAG TPA: hypothetical protein VJ885_10405, partial [Thermoanaerobaculia bacterium]|nr:hypothetical protein [Thermoanaerobaculia bacterium]